MVNKFSEVRERFTGETRRALKRRPLSFLCDVAADYGDLVQFHWDGYPVYMVNHPDDVQDVLLTRQKSFVRSGGPVPLARLLGNGLLRSQGEEHLRQRRLTQPAFHSRAMEQYGDIIVRRTSEQLLPLPVDTPLDLHWEIVQLTLGIAAEAFFGVASELDPSPIGRDFDIAIRNLPPGNFALQRWWRGYRFDRAVNRLDRVVFAVIERRRQDSARCLLSTLINSRDDDGDGGKMNDTQLRDELMTIFLAGHETTASSLTWALYLLATNPAQQEALYREISETDSTGLDVSALRLVRGAFAEALRLYPPAWILFRRALADCEIKGCAIPKNSHVLLSPYVMGRDSRFFANPENFEPQRWNEEAESRLPKGAFFPFGLGNRRCVGESFAWNEGILILAILLQRFRIEMASEAEIKAFPGFTLRPKRGLNVILRVRN